MASQKSNSRNAFRLQPIKKTVCKAKLKCIHASWQVLSIVFDHNHELCTSSKARYYRANRIPKAYAKRKLDLNRAQGGSTNFGVLSELF